MKKKKNIIMGFTLFKNISLLLLLILFAAFLISTSFASRLPIPVESNDHASTTYEENETWEALLSHDEIASDVQERRALKVKTNDYGRYDPAPAFAKPRFKLIPN